MKMLYRLIIVSGLCLAIETATAYGENGYASAVNKVSQNAIYELATGFEPGDFSSVRIRSWAGGNISVYFYRYDDNWNLLWSAYWPNWGTVGQDGTYTSTPGEVQITDEGIWQMYWGVDGFPLSPENWNENYFASAPQLPTFPVSYSYSGLNYPPWNGAYWPYSPVRYYDPSSQFSSPYFEWAAWVWTLVSNYEIIFTPWSSPTMIEVIDGPTFDGVPAETLRAKYLQNCVGVCSKLCLYNAYQHDYVELDLDKIGLMYSAYVQANGALTYDEILSNMIGHELGHAMGLEHPYGAKGICA
jgi:hypothetical protein